MKSNLEYLGAEQFFDCGDSRDGTGYKKVTGSTEPEVKAARARFAGILATMPAPVAHDIGAQPAAAKKNNKKATVP